MSESISSSTTGDVIITGDVTITGVKNSGLFLQTFQYVQEVFCTVIFEATHNWPGVTAFPQYKEVDYLQYPHRHRFFIKAHSKVTHSDRDVEFIWLAHRIEEYLIETYPDRDFGAKSCEMLAIELLEQFPDYLYKVEVSEDNENGSVVEKVVHG